MNGDKSEKEIDKLKKNIKYTCVLEAVITWLDVLRKGHILEPIITVYSQQYETNLRNYTKTSYLQKDWNSCFIWIIANNPKNSKHNKTQTKHNLVHSLRKKYAVEGTKTATCNVQACISFLAID